MHYGGRFQQTPNLTYVDGFLWEEKNCQIYEFSYVVLMKTLGDLGCENVSKVWYLIPGQTLDKGLMVISNNQEALNMANIAESYGTIDIFVEHLVDDKDVSINTFLDNEFGVLEKESNESFDDDVVNNSDGDDEDNVKDIKFPDSEEECGDMFDVYINVDAEMICNENLTVNCSSSRTGLANIEHCSRLVELKHVTEMPIENDVTGLGPTTTASNKEDTFEQYYFAKMSRSEEIPSKKRPCTVKNRSAKISGSQGKGTEVKRAPIIWERNHCVIGDTLVTASKGTKQKNASSKIATSQESIALPVKKSN
ncbi:Transposase, MuDR, plant [Quillaja saponaria]|uniref:Transposase, MuDR, plant n=1 Tax=Quillaja saponaria TaxID=32244 RepID=A0AAD7PL01_QUISA|nr:Transposase, MuDR, plant [Quillaja saponaria]